MYMYSNSFYNIYYHINLSIIQPHAGSGTPLLDQKMPNTHIKSLNYVRYWKLNQVPAQMQLVTLWFTALNWLNEGALPSCKK